MAGCANPDLRNKIEWVIRQYLRKHTDWIAEDMGHREVSFEGQINTVDLAEEIVTEVIEGYVDEEF